jgi:hypothetical protein
VIGENAPFLSVIHYTKGGVLMPVRDIVKEALGEFIVRACAKESLTDDQIKAVEIYLDHFGSPQPRQNRIEQTARESEPLIVPYADSFPNEGWVTAAQIAKVLGFGDLKHPEGKIRRLANEGIIPQPVHVGDKTPRWRAEDIRKNKESVEKGIKAA